MTEETPPVPTVRDRLRYLSDARVAEHLAAGRIRVDGVRVDDLTQPAPDGTRVVLAGT